MRFNNIAGWVFLLTALYALIGENEDMLAMMCMVLAKLSWIHDSILTGERYVSKKLEVKR